MVAVDIAALLFFCKRRGVIGWLAAMGCAGMVAVLAAGALERNFLGAARLGAWGLFLHGSLLLCGSAVILWRRRQRLPSIGLAVCAVALLAVYADAFLLEPTWLEISRVRITSDKLQRPVRVVVLADLQTDRLGDYERMVFRRVLEEKPDVILLVGDYLQVSRQRRGELTEEYNAHLRQINFTAPLGVFAVQGNIDQGRWWEMFDGLDVNAVHADKSFEVAGLRLSCLSLFSSYNSQLRLRNADPDRFHLVVGHIPNFALGNVEADLLVAGHTHGGQVRIPLIGPLLNFSKVPKAWTAGMTDLPSGGKLLVSRGVGVERGKAPQLRFLCRPQLVVIELEPAE